jgi:biopolymer transport protein ExbD
MAGGGGGGDGEPEFQIAPMIDVLLVLLIFFMSITTAQVMKVDSEIRLPVAPNAAKREGKRSEAIVNIRWDPVAKKATYRYDEKNLDLTQLTAALVAAKKLAEVDLTKSESPAFFCVIRGDQDASALSVSMAMNAAAEAGISDISFSAASRAGK